MLKRAPLKHSPTLGWYVDLPSYTMQDGTFAPITQGKITKSGIAPNVDPNLVLQLQPSVLVEIPENTPFSDDGQIDQVSLCHMYRNHPYFGTKHYTPPQLADLTDADVQQQKDPALLVKFSAWLERLRDK